MNSKITVNGLEIHLGTKDHADFISLTDMARGSEGDQLIKNWLKSKNTIEFLGVWEQLNNPNFKMVEFDLIRFEAGTNRFLLSTNQWVEKTNAKGIFAKAGRYGGTYAHKDIAFHFGLWISPEFNVLLIREFQRLKEEESRRINSEWDYRRFLSKVNYRLQTDAVKDKIIPTYPFLTKEQETYIYANEAELINMATFGTTSKAWREENPKEVLAGRNMRDLATVPQLTVLANLENYNSILITEGMSPPLRLDKLKLEAIRQLKVFSSVSDPYSIESPYKGESSTS